jgi:hypothetical protein
LVQKFMILLLQVNIVSMSYPNAILSGCILSGFVHFLLAYFVVAIAFAPHVFGNGAKLGPWGILLPLFGRPAPGRHGW